MPRTITCTTGILRGAPDAFPCAVPGRTSTAPGRGGEAAGGDGFPPLRSGPGTSGAKASVTDGFPPLDSRTAATVRKVRATGTFRTVDPAGAPTGPLGAGHPRSPLPYKQC